MLLDIQSFRTQNLQQDQLEMFDLMTELFPICRSITGNGVRDTLKIINKRIKLQIREIPSGTRVFDWIIPKEWNIADAYIIDPNGTKIVDFKKSNLHVVNYSIPVRKKMNLNELKSHLHTLPDQPDLIPYLTTYYKEEWGFCISHNQLQELKDGEYDVCIDSSLTEGYLTFGEYFLKGEIEDEILLTCYVCHPSLCNDNLSGIVLLTSLASYLSKVQTRYSYRFLFIPETIGSITWLSLNENKISKIKHGLVATCVGDPGKSTYKKSRRGNAEIDKVVQHVLKFSNSDYDVIDFFPMGSDERQFCSPAFNLPVGSLMRSTYNKFSQYHTSGDNLEFVKPESLSDSLAKYVSVLFILENNRTYVNLNPKCEPQLGRRGLYSMMGGQKNGRINESVLLWILNLSDGDNSLLDIAEKSGFAFDTIKKAVDMLFEKSLLKEID